MNLQYVPAVSHLIIMQTRLFAGLSTHADQRATHAAGNHSPNVALFLAAPEVKPTVMML